MNKIEIPEEHRLLCPGCGEILDMRDISVLGHGWIENGEIVCYKVDGLGCSSSKRVGDNVEWTRDKKAIHLN